MRHLTSALRAFALAALLTNACAQASPPAQGQAATPATPAAAIPPAAAADALRLPVPRPVRATSELAGLGPQRLALVIGLGRVGLQTVLPAAALDVAAVARRLRDGGYLVMQREDVTAGDLRAALAEFRQRLQPDGYGFVYVTALGLQAPGGGNRLLTRDSPLAGPAAAWRDGGVALDEVVDAMAATGRGPRWLVVDAAHAHPALAALQQAGLAAPQLPPGLAALLSRQPGQARPPADAAAPGPATPGAPPVAASPFAMALVAALGQPRIAGAEALARVKAERARDSGGTDDPWLGGVARDDEWAAARIVDSLLPQTPEEFARDAASRLLRRDGGGERPVSELLQQAQPAPSAAPATPQGTAQPLDAGRALADGAARQATEAALRTVAGAGTGAATVAAVAAAPAMAAATPATAAATAGATTVAGAATELAAGGAAAATRALAGGQANAAMAPAAPMQALVRAATALSTPSAPETRSAAPAPAVFASPAPAPAPATTPAPARPGAAAPHTDGRTLRAPQGGERPFYQPRTNRHGHAEGDTYTYRVVDTWRGETAGQQTLAVEEVLHDGTMLANGQQWQLDEQGRTVRWRDDAGNESRFEPVQALWWMAPQRGQEQALRFVETYRRADGRSGRIEWSGSAEVGRPRRIETPAGPFDALPIEAEGWKHEQPAGGEPQRVRFSQVTWFAPRLGRPVLVEIVERDAGSRLLRRERIELLHAQTARQAP